MRREINEINPQDSKLEDLQLEYKQQKDDLKAAGLNEDAFNNALPRAQAVARKLTDTAQVQDLLASKKDFSSGGIFFHANTLIFNSNTVIQAQVKSLEEIEEKKNEVEDGKEAENEAMEAQAFKSYEAYTKTDNKGNVLATDYKSMLKFLIYLSPNENKPISSYKNKGQIVEKLKDMN